MCIVKKLYKLIWLIWCVCVWSCRISRILESPVGNALLIGVGGSGKQSLCRLAAFLSVLEVFQITLRKGYGISDLRVTYLHKLHFHDLSFLFKYAALWKTFASFLLSFPVEWYCCIVHKGRSKEHWHSLPPHRCPDSRWKIPGPDQRHASIRCTLQTPHFFFHLHHLSSVSIAQFVYVIFFLLKLLSKYMGIITILT